METGRLIYSFAHCCVSLLPNIKAQNNNKDPSGHTSGVCRNPAVKRTATPGLTRKRPHKKGPGAPRGANRATS